MPDTDTIPAPSSPPQPEPPQPPPAARHRSTRHVVSIVSGSVVGLLSFALLAGGAAALWANGEKKDDGYLWSSTERVSTHTSALATENADVDLDGAGWLVDSGSLGKIRLKATSRTDAPIFVGIARTSDVARYLHGTRHATVTDIHTKTFRTKFHIDTRTTNGTRAVGAPIDQRFWAASSYGMGTREFTWKIKDGNWSVVVMNADGSKNVDAAVSGGAEAPFLAPLGWSLLGGGLVLLIGAGGLIALGVRGSRPRLAEPTAAEPTPTDEPTPAA
jgi:hypothetical protein